MPGWCSCAPRTPPAHSSPRRCGPGKRGSRDLGRHPPAAAIAPGAVATARRHGLRAGPGRAPAARRRPRAGDYVIAVCDNAYEELDPGTGRVHWSVPDPVRVGTAAAFDAAYDDLAGRVAHLAPRLSRARRFLRSTR